MKSLRWGLVVVLLASILALSSVPGAVMSTGPGLTLAGIGTSPSKGGPR